MKGEVFDDDSSIDAGADAYYQEIAMVIITEMCIESEAGTVYKSSVRASSNSESDDNDNADF